MPCAAELPALLLLEKNRGERLPVDLDSNAAALIARPIGALLVREDSLECAGSREDVASVKDLSAVFTRLRRSLFGGGPTLSGNLDCSCLSGVDCVVFEGAIVHNHISDVFSGDDSHVTQAWSSGRIQTKTSTEP